MGRAVEFDVGVSPADRGCETPPPEFDLSKVQVDGRLAAAPGVSKTTSSVVTKRVALADSRLRAVGMARHGIQLAVATETGGEVECPD